MNITTRILTVAGLLGVIGLGGTVLMYGQSQRADAAITSAEAEETTSPVPESDAVPAMHFKHHGAKLEETAKLFGITTDELGKELQSGKPFYQIAAEHGVTYDKLKEQHRADLKTKLGDMLKVGFMTQPEADEILNKTDELPAFGMDFERHGKFGMMKMMD